MRYKRSVRRLIPLLLLAATAVVAGSQTAPGRAASGAAPTFYRDVLPVLQANCQTCHQKQGASFGGLVAPMPLTTYEEVRPWAAAISKAVESRQMPPWLASPATKGVFLNQRGLSAAQITTFVAWERGGAQAGVRPAILPAGPAPARAGGWTLGEPNLDL